jgi:hypothetical protein
MVIALTVNSEGFPFSYETFDGNRADVTTMETILRMVERKYGKARRIWVFDRGIVSEENLAAIRKRGGQYLVGTPRSQMKQFEEELLQDDWIQVRPEVEVKKVAIAQGEETFLLCRTSGRKEKEKAIRDCFSNRMEEALKRLAKGIEDLSRSLCKHSSVNCLSALPARNRGNFAWPGQVGADQRFCLCICPLSFLIGDSSERPAAVQGARVVRGGGKSFPLLKRFSVAHPGRRGPFWNMARKGKGAGVSGGVPLAGSGASGWTQPSCVRTPTGGRYPNDECSRFWL